MNGTNYGRIILGGLTAGLVVNVLETVLNVFVVGDAWADAMGALGIEQGGAAITLYVVFGFVIGIVAIWLYAAVRPRLGPGPVTAVKVGLVVWFLGWLWPTVGMLTWGMFPADLLWFSIAWSLIELPLATLVGAWVYRE